MRHVKLPPVDCYRTPYARSSKQIYKVYTAMRSQSSDFNLWVKRQYARQDAKCFYCLESLKTRRLNVEHVRPISKGGTNESSNLVLSCPDCNKRKGSTRLPKKIESLHLSRNSGLKSNIRK